MNVSVGGLDTGTHRMKSLISTLRLGRLVEYEHHPFATDDWHFLNVDRVDRKTSKQTADIQARWPGRRAL